jgi:hypothetical protein
MSGAGEILDVEDIRNLMDIYAMFSYIISRCDLSGEEYQTALKTNDNLKKLLSDLSGPSGEPM